jgi:cell fate regulator YaaT (PSP1 superfamily)
VSERETKEPEEGLSPGIRFGGPGGLRAARDAGPEKGAGAPCRKTVAVRLRYGGNVMVFDCGDADLEIGVWVLVRHNDLIRVGMVTQSPIRWDPEGASGRVHLPGDREFLRVATIDDLARQAENQLLEREEFEFCRSRAKKLGLPMKLVTVEITFDNYKSIFYYTSDERVDFRQLVKDLVRRLRTRVEMRQISMRHEAMMLGGVGTCGRQLCCSGFLKNFNPVSVRMAKEQRLSINTTKISGLCGRLMCCLAFENPPVGGGQRGAQGRSGSIQAFKGGESKDGGKIVAKKRASKEGRRSGSPAPLKEETPAENGQADDDVEEGREKASPNRCRENRRPRPRVSDPEVLSEYVETGLSETFGPDGEAEETEDSGG